MKTQWTLQLKISNLALNLDDHHGYKSDSCITEINQNSLCWGILRILSFQIFIYKLNRVQAFVLLMRGINLSDEGLPYLPGLAPLESFYFLHGQANLFRKN